MHQCLLTLKMRPISKKNSKRLIMRGRTRFLVPSKAYETFEKEAVFQIHRQLPADFKPFTTPIAATYNFILKGRLKADADNLIAGVNDILQKAGVISDDDLIVVGAWHKAGGGKDWVTKIELEDFAQETLLTK